MRGGRYQLQESGPRGKQPADHGQSPVMRNLTGYVINSGTASTSILLSHVAVHPCAIAARNIDLMFFQEIPNASMQASRAE